MSQPENGGAYPDAHYDEYDECQCPDHVAMREAARWSAMQAFIEHAAGDPK